MKDIKALIFVIIYNGSCLNLQSFIIFSNMQFFKTFIHYLTLPLHGNLTLYIFSNIFLFIPLIAFNGIKSVVWMSFHLHPLVFQSLVLSLVVTFLCFALAKIAELIHKHVGGAIRFATFLAAFAISFVNIFLNSAFNIRLHHYALVLLHETTPTESNEFISTYMFSPAMFSTLIYMVVIPVAIYFLSIPLGHWTFEITAKEDPNESHSLNHYIGGGILLISLLILPSMLQWFGTPYIYKYNRCPFVQNPIFLLYNGIGMYNENEHENQACIDRCKEVDLKTSCDFTSKNIVLIIGESYNRHHASMYGYKLPTTLPLDTIQNITVFSDVITPANATARSFRLFFSTIENTPNKKWCDGPMIPSVFRKVGFEVNFWTTQFPYGELMDANNSYAAYFNQKELSDLCFTHRNNTVCTYDGELIDDYFSRSDQLETGNPTLTIFHLYGQHVAPASRLPKGYGKFCIDDYTDRDLPDDQCQQIADYDNATLYNAEQVARIIDHYRDKDAIVIYFADHGDEANDFRPHVGRSYDFPGHGSDVVHCQFDIPFIVFTSQQYRSNHPDIVQALDGAKDKPYSIDALSHMMFYIAGIHCKWYNQTLNPLSDKYDRKVRLIYNLTSHTYHSYDELVK